MSYRTPKSKFSVNTKDSILGGVAQGIADATSLDPLFVRILFVILTIIGGLGIVIYLLLLLFMSRNHQT